MARKLESKIENATCNRILNELGVANIKLKALGHDGFPDRLFWIPGGRPLMIEFKRPGEIPEPHQAHIHGFLRLLGYDVQVHDDADRAVGAVKEALEIALRKLGLKGGPL